MPAWCPAGHVRSPSPAPRLAGPVPALLGWDASTGPPERQQAKGKLDNLQACGPLRATWLRACPAGSRGARGTGPLGRWGVPGSCRSAPPRPGFCTPPPSCGKPGCLLDLRRLGCRTPPAEGRGRGSGNVNQVWGPSARPACPLTFRKPPPVSSMTAARARALQSSGKPPASPP